MEKSYLDQTKVKLVSSPLNTKVRNSKDVQWRMHMVLHGVQRLQSTHKTILDIAIALLVKFTYLFTNSSSIIRKIRYYYDLLLYTVLHISLEWKKKDAEICTSRYGLKSFDTLEEARENCVKQEKCYKISDRNCLNSERKSYMLCMDGVAGDAHWVSGCTYEKPGNELIKHV